MSITELRKLCVDAFALSSTRNEIMHGLDTLIRELINKGIECEVWVNGSFVTMKLDPNDVDILIRLQSDFVDSATDEQRQVIEWATDDSVRELLKCDSYPLVEYPQDHQQYWVGEYMYAYWMRQWGFDRGNQMKGIAVIRIP